MIMQVANLPERIRIPVLEVSLQDQNPPYPNHDKTHRSRPPYTNLNATRLNYRSAQSPMQLVADLVETERNIPKFETIKYQPFFIEWSTQ